MKYLSHVDKYLTLKYKYKYKYFEMVLEYYSSTSTSTKYYISGNSRTSHTKTHQEDAHVSFGAHHEYLNEDRCISDEDYAAQRL